jgi:diguanylate cyclase (GGDEF)-like protein
MTDRQRTLLTPLLVPVLVLGTVALAAAVLDLAGSLSPAEVGALVVLMAAATLAETFPVPVGRSSMGSVSLSALFILAGGLLFGWAAATVVAFCASVAVQVIERKEVRRVCYNAGAYAIAGALGGLAMEATGGNQTVATLVISACVGSIVFWLVNITLISAAIARVTRQGVVFLLRVTALESFVPGAVMASTTVMLVALADSSHYLPLTLIGPLAAITLYQRTVHRSLTAMKLARTDSLTELGNYRHFTEKLDGLEAAASEGEVTVSLCLFDLDDFKSINDLHGHVAGDSALQHVARALRQNGEAFRLGGDEFAIVLDGRTEAEALSIAARVMERVARTAFKHGENVGLSVGIASYPQDGLDISELVTCADVALYAAKGGGKNQVSCYRPGVAPPPRGPVVERSSGVAASRVARRGRPAQAA